MSRTRYVIDSNILTGILRREPEVIERVSLALSVNAEFLLCPVVYFEVYRGLLNRDARKQMAVFQQYVNTLTWEDLVREDWEAVGETWAQLRRNGRPIEDADLLIATYALRRQATVVTDNVRHFDPIGVSVENWRR